MFPLALLARDGRVGLAHRAQSLKLFPTILAVILIDWHRLTPVEIRPLFYPRFHLTSTHLEFGLSNQADLFAHFFKDGQHAIQLLVGVGRHVASAQ